MYLIVFLIEVIGIYFYLEFDKAEKITKPHNSHYFSQNSYKNDILILTNIKREDKLNAWNNSYTKEEILSDISNIENIIYDIETKIIDSSNFKQDLIDYIEYIHGEYMAGNISYKEYRNALYNPNPKLPKY